MGALTKAGTPDAVRAIANLARDVEATEELRGTAIDHLSIMHEPTLESIAQLEQLKSDETLDPELRNSATLGLAAATRTSASDVLSDEQKAHYLQQFELDLDNAGSTNERKLAISAIGNAAPAEALKLLEAPLSSGTSSERSSAVYALRHVDNPEAEARVVSIMLEDDSARVRGSAAAALGGRSSVSEQSASALGRAMITETDAAVQRSLIQVAAGLLRQYPELKSAVTHLAATGADEDTRKQAASVIDSFQRFDDSQESSLVNP
jgi:HEAT repeat protein